MQAIGGWDKPDVAQAQLTLVTTELASMDTVGPFIAFRWAMQQIAPSKGATLLDVGCGVGHYGVLCERYFPGVRYYGNDAYEPMIGRAKLLAPLGGFAVCPFIESSFAAYDIVLISQVVETMPDPPAMMRLALSRCAKTVILHRIRLTTDASHEIEETTYCGNVGHEWLWNMAELRALIADYGTVRYCSLWDNENMATLVVEVKHDKPAGLCGCGCGNACSCQSA
jgi:SAM-dependent methyltransferase